MPRRTLFLIVLLILITAGLLYIALAPRTATTPQPDVAVETPTPTPATHTSLMLTPNPLNLSTSSATVNVDIDTRENVITAIQLEIMYDPRVLTNVRVTPSDFFENSIVLINEVDTQNGVVTLAFGIPPTGSGKSGSGTVATLSFQRLTAAAATTSMSFGPGTQVTAEGQAESVIRDTSGTTIILSPLPTTPPPPPTTTE